MFAAVMRVVPAFGFFIRNPDGGKTSGFRGHDVNAVSKVHRKRGYAGADKFENFILNKSAFKNSADKRQGDVLGADARDGSVVEVHGDNLRRSDVIGLAKQLFSQFATAFAHSQRAQRAIAGMAVGAENHAAAARSVFAHILVDDSLVGRYIDAAEALGCGQAEKMIVLVNGAAYGAERVVAVGEDVGQGKLL